MNILEFNNVWKKFKRGEKLNSLRDALPHYCSLLLSQAKRKDSLDAMEFWAVEGLDFQVQKGDILGIIGPNGAGKSTVLKLLSKIILPDKGNIKINGRLSALIEVTAGFHPELTGRENVYLNGTIMGMSKKEIDSKFDEIVEFSGLKDFINTPVKRYSSGMYSRLGFSVAAHMDPDILLVDEVLSVGDMAFQSKCVRKMKELLSSGATIVLVSHDLGLVENLCKRVILIDEGKSLKEGLTGEVIPYYQDLVYRKSEEDIKRQIQSGGNKVRVNESTKVNITGVTLADSKGKSGDRFQTGEPLSATFNYNAIEKIPHPIFALEILRPDGVVCCDSNTRYDEFSIESIEGDGSIQIGLGHLPLVPGIYIIKVSVWDKDLLHPYTIRKNDILRLEKGAAATNVPKGIFFTKYQWKILE
jgi:ABC-type polysaccharide/polyol phosphate transport system ATPase subunit